MIRTALGPCLLATFLLFPLACEDNLREVCHAPVLTVTTADVYGADPNVLCDPDTLTCATLQQAFNTVSMCREVDQTVALLPDAVYEIRYADTPIVELGRAHADQVDALGASGLPSIVGFATIEGNGATLRQVSSGSGRLLNVLPGSELVVRDLVFEDADSYANGGAVSNAGTQTLEQTTFRDNTGRNLDGATGGAIYNTGTLVVRDSDFIENQAARGGSIDNAAGSARVERSTFTEHSGVSTALSNAAGASLAVVDSLFEGNGSDDGAIDSRGELTTAALFAARAGASLESFDRTAIRARHLADEAGDRELDAWACLPMAGAQMRMDEREEALEACARGLGILDPRQTRLRASLLDAAGITQALRESSPKPSGSQKRRASESGPGRSA